MSWIAAVNGKGNAQRIERLSQLRQLVYDLGLDDSVRFLGDVSDVYGRMAGWDLFAYATTEREGLGNAVAEAMMFGLPCVITDVGPMHEFGCEGATARMVPRTNPQALAEAVCKLIPDLKSRQELSEHGREYALAKFHPRVFAERYADILGLANKP
jgi:glycosyltransferase involved in cell wall biosynthesis